MRVEIEELMQAIAEIQSKNLAEIVEVDEAEVTEELEEIVESEEVTEELEEIVESEEANEEPDIFVDYQRHTGLYKEFMKGYDIQSDSTAYEFEDAEHKEFEWGDEVISYKERKEFVRCVQMNALMQGEHNPVDPQIKERYEFWKYASKFNLTMSFLMYSSFMNT